MHARVADRGHVATKSPFSYTQCIFSFIVWPGKCNLNITDKCLGLVRSR